MIQVTKKQKEALECLENGNVFFKGGRASGKKTLCAIALIKYCKENRNKRCLFVSDKIVSITIDVFINMLEKNFPTVDFNYNRINYKITFNNGSIVYFKDIRKEDGIIYYDFVAGTNVNINNIKCKKYLLCHEEFRSVVGATYIHASFEDNRFLPEEYKEVIREHENKQLSFMRPPTSKTETLEEKVLKLKNRLADLEITRLASPKGDNRINYELTKSIDNLKCSIKTLEKRTDIQKFKELYDNLGVKYEIICNQIRIYQENGKKIVGDVGFYSIIQFDEDGKFVNQGFFEE